MSANHVAARRRIKNGEIDIRIGVSRVEETTKADRFRCFPDLEDAVHIKKVLEEAAMFVPALAGADGAEDGDEGRQLLVDAFEFAAEEGTSRI